MLVLKNRRLDKRPHCGSYSSLRFVCNYELAEFVMVPSSKIAALTTIISIMALITYTYIFAYSGIALDEMMSYEMYFKENYSKLWLLFFLLLLLAVSSLINLIIVSKKEPLR